MSKLRDLFYKESGCTWINGDGEPDIDYVKWLEDKVEKLTPSIEHNEPEHICPNPRCLSLLSQLEYRTGSCYSCRATLSA